MINAGALFKTAQQMVTANSPVLLMASAITGVATTGYLAARGGILATRALDEAEREAEFYRKDPDQPLLSFNEQLQVVWRFYLPAALSGAGTVGCIVGAHSVHTRRNAAILGAYSLSEKAYQEYRDKITEVLGEKKARSLDDSLAQDRVTATPASSQVIIAAGGETLCFEALTGRYFMSDVETIRRAENTLNREINSAMYASHSDFCVLVGLPSTPYGDEIGWNNDHPLDILFSYTGAEDGRPCLCVDYRNHPKPNFYKSNN